MSLPARPLRHQRGGFALGLVIGLLIGLAVALGVALYIAKVPVPFVDKVGHRSADQDAAEAEKLKTWDPNAGLAGKPVPRPANVASAPSAASAPGPATAPAATAAVVPPAVPASAAASSAKPAKSSRDPAAILAGETPAEAKPGQAPALAADAITYYVQVGAFSSQGDAEQQRAKLAMQGVTTKIVEREQGGRTVYRVRLGPIDVREEAEQQQERLKSMGADAMLVRVERNKP